MLSTAKCNTESQEGCETKEEPGTKVTVSGPRNITIQRLKTRKILQSHSWTFWYEKLCTSAISLLLFVILTKTGTRPGYGRKPPTITVQKNGLWHTTIRWDLLVLELDLSTNPLCFKHSTSSASPGICELVTPFAIFSLLEARTANFVCVDYGMAHNDQIFAL